MNGRDEELLSAYFDGELTGDEQSRAEQLLAESTVAREALDEFAEVSSRLRDLPRPPAPAGVREDVLRRLRAHSPPVRVPAADSRPRWRRPAAWIGSVAAGLLVAVVGYQQWPEREPAAGRQTPAGTAVAMRDSSVQADGLQPLAPFGAVPGSGVVGLDAYHLNPENAGFRARHAGESEALARQPQNATSLALTNASVIQNEFQLLVERGEAPVPGQMYSGVSQVEGQLVVTQYSVIDTEKLLGQIQFVLTDNGIVTLPDTEADSTLRDRVAADMKEHGRSQAIYVEAPTANFYNAVDQIAQLASVTKVSANTVFVNDINAVSDGLAAEEKPAATDEAEKQSESRDFSTAAVAERQSRHDAPSAVAAAKPEPSKDAAAPVPPALASLGYQEQAPTPPPQSERRYLYFGTPAESSSVAAYQVVVPARRELLEELQQQPQAFFDAEGRAAAPAEQAAVAKKSQSQVQRRAWNQPAPGIKAAPADSDRIRAVILLVPQQEQ